MEKGRYDKPVKYHSMKYEVPQKELMFLEANWASQWWGRSNETNQISTETEQQIVFYSIVQIVVDWRGRNTTAWKEGDVLNTKGEWNTVIRKEGELL